jgi:3-oxoadipate enol-lactonase
VLAACAQQGITRAHFVGHSMGTIVCQHVAAAAPALVRSLCLFGPLMAPTDPMRAGLRARAAQARSDGLPGMQAITQTLVQAALSAHTREQQPVTVAFVRESLMRQAPEAYAATCEALAHMQAAAVDTLTAPLLLVTGDEDGVAPPQAVRAMAEKFHRAHSTRVVVLPRCGHWTPIERAENCARELAEFLAAQARS